MYAIRTRKLGGRTYRPFERKKRRKTASTTHFICTRAQHFRLEFSEQVQRLRMVDLVGRPEAMALARPAVDRIIHLTDPFVAGRVEVDALGEVLADQAVGVLVGAAPPGMVRQREVEDRAGRLLDPRMAKSIGRFLSQCAPYVFGYGIQPCWQGYAWLTFAGHSKSPEAPRRCSPQISSVEKSCLTKTTLTMTYRSDVCSPGSCAP